MKVEGLSAAICYYYYAHLFFFLLPPIILLNVINCAPDLSPTTVIVLNGFRKDVLQPVAMELWVCFLEGKRVPTFPLCCCRHQESSEQSHRPQAGLQMTPALGKALKLLAKHGLDEARKKDFPVNVAMESLLSSTTLEVAAAEDMGLKRSEHHPASLSPLLSYLWRPRFYFLRCHLAFPHLVLSPFPPGTSSTFSTAVWMSTGSLLRDSPSCWSEKYCEEVSPSTKLPKRTSWNCV